jgi:hypothetical protein
MGYTYPNEINRILYKPGGDVGRYARKIALEIAEEAKQLAKNELGKNPKDRPRTGRLSLSYRVTVIPGTNIFRVNNSRDYATAIELGAKPHEIRARRVEYLQFRGRDGRLRRVKMVFHPGNKSYLLMDRAADTATARRFGTVRKG